MLEILHVSSMTAIIACEAGSVGRMFFVFDISMLQCVNDLWFLRLFYHLTPQCWATIKLLPNLRLFAVQYFALHNRSCRVSAIIIQHAFRGACP
jgi:hypothetical protein